MADVLRSLFRHQVASAASTVVDFGMLLILVEGAGVEAPVATLFASLTAGVLNFALGRRFTFQAGFGGARGQAARYALVSVGCAALNALGVWVFEGALGGMYPLARALVGFVVSVGWSYPLQRHFVFRPRRGGTVIACTRVG